MTVLLLAGVAGPIAFPLYRGPSHAVGRLRPTCVLGTQWDEQLTDRPGSLEKGRELDLLRVAISTTFWFGATVAQEQSATLHAESSKLRLSCLLVSDFVLPWPAVEGPG